MSDTWLETLRRQQSQLRMIADWAAIVGYGEVRDHIRCAVASLERHIEFKQDMEAEKAGGGDGND